MANPTKSLIIGIAAGAMVLGSATPALAQDRHGRGHDRGPSTGEVIAGALVIGGLAALLASDDDRHDRRYDDYRDDRRGDYRGGYHDNDRSRAQASVEQCVRRAEARAERLTGGRAEVYEIREVDRQRGGFEVRGRIAVRMPHYRGGRGDYWRGYGNDGWEEGRFTCDWHRGEVTNIDYSGIRSL